MHCRLSKPTKRTISKHRPPWSLSWIGALLFLVVSCGSGELGGPMDVSDGDTSVGATAVDGAKKIKNKVTVSGGVSESTTGDPIPEATVLLRNKVTKALIRTSTDAEGLFFFADVPLAKYALVARKLGYERHREGLGKLRAGDELERNIQLSSSERPEPGTKLVNLSECSGRNATIPGLPGNVADVVATSGDQAFITWLSGSGEQVPIMTRYDGEDCDQTVQVNSQAFSPGGFSHGAPSVFVDGLGYVYATYMGDGRALGWTSKVDYRRWLRRSTRPNDISEWEPEVLDRLWNGAELNGLQLEDGAVLIAGSDRASRIDIIEPGGRYRWPASRQVVTQNPKASGGGEGGCTGPRFTKAVYTRGDSGNLYVVWGWAKGPNQPEADCQGYPTDSHEVFFAYSSDGGVTWKNRRGNREVIAPLCPELDDCRNVVTQGIVHDDPDFQLTSTRQREFRGIWEHDDGTVYVAFSKSMWCNSGYCPTRDVTHPGALMLLTFRTGEGSVDQTMINPESHFRVAGVRREGNNIYVWAVTDKEKRASPITTSPRTFYEYVSTDAGETWAREVISTQVDRIHAETDTPDAFSARVVFKRGSNSVFMYERTF